MKKEDFIAEITFQDDFFDKINTSSKKFVHLIVIASKPDIIKQAPLITELKKRDELLVIAHTGQHYDWNYSGAMEEEFEINPDFNLNIKGATYQKTAQIIERLGMIIDAIQKTGKIAVPYVHGDTSTCMAASNAAYSNMAACVHVEAGIRTMTPKKEILDTLLDNFNFDSYYQALQDENSWERGSNEPFPEQFNTRAAAPAIGFHAAATELNRKFLLQEGYYADRIFVTGNSVVDATKFALDRAKDSKIFKQYPKLKEGFIRFCIHRRENLNSKHRFMAIFEAMKKIIEEGKNVLLISLNGTEQAIEYYGLRNEIKELQEKYPNFIYSLVWPFYTDTIAAMEKAIVCATDSGSMQEEMNFMSIPCVTLRFNTDRPESAICGGNLIAPPINNEVVYKVVKAAEENAEKLKSAPKIYGENPSQKILDGVKEILEKEGRLFRWEHERLGYDKMPLWQKGEMRW